MNMTKYNLLFKRLVFGDDPLNRLLKLVFCFTGLFLVMEMMIRQFTGMIDMMSLERNIFMSILFSILLFYTTKTFKILLSTFLLNSLLFQASHAVFYAGWIDPVNLYLFFENTPEVIDIVREFGAFMILKFLLLVLCSTLIITFLHKLAKHRGFIWVNVIVIIFFIYQPVRDGILEPKKIETRKTKDNHSLIRSFHNSYGVFLSMLISEALGKNIYTRYRQSPHSRTLGKQPLIPNIFIYYGESLSSRYMSLYGYKKNNTLYQTLSSFTAKQKTLWFVEGNGRWFNRHLLLNRTIFSFVKQTRCKETGCLFQYQFISVCAQSGI